MNAGSSYGYYIVATQQLPNPYSVWILLCLEIRGSMSLFSPLGPERRARERVRHYF